MPTTMKLIAKNTLGADAANVSFTSIPDTYTDLYLVCSARSTRASSVQDPIELRFNGTGTTNLSSRLLYGDGASAASTTSTRIYAYSITAASATANTFGIVEAYIPNYAGSINKSVSITAASETNGTTAFVSASAGLWSDTAAITDIYVYAANGSLLSGSSFFLYGITKA